MSIDVQGQFCTLLYVLCFCTALNTELVFQVLDKSDPDVSLRQEEKEVSLMNKGKKRIQFTYISCNVLSLFQYDLCHISYVGYRSEVG